MGRAKVSPTRWSDDAIEPDRRSWHLARRDGARRLRRGRRAEILATAQPLADGAHRPRPQSVVTPDDETSLTAAEEARLNERLREAARADDVAEARRLIRRGANVNAKDETVQSAYLISTSEGYLGLLRLTLRNGAKIGDKDSWNGTGLIRAAERGHHGVVGELLRAGIVRDHVNRIGYQAIHEAVWLGEDTDDYATTVRVLAAGGVQLNRRVT